MGGVPKNGEGTECIHTWGGETANWKATTERVGWEVVLPLTGGGHEGGGLTNVRTSINIRQNTVAQYIATRPLLELCEGATQREGERVTLRWWDPTGIDWEKAKAREAETESASESGTDLDLEGGGGARHRKQDKRIKWGGMERSECRRMGSTET